MRPGYRRPTRRRPWQWGAALAAPVFVTLVVACGSGGGGSGAASGVLGSGPPQGQVPATPPDAPSQAPGCAGSLDKQPYVPTDLQSLVSACQSPQGDQLELTNLSQYVLDVAPAPGTTAQLTVVDHDTSSDPLPTLAGQLEVQAQNTVVDGWSAGDPSAVLLPVGGKVDATADNPQTPVRLTVSVDAQVSRMSFEAAAWTSYVVSNVLDENPGDYYQAIADCVNNSYQAWQDLQQQPPPPVAELLYKTLQAGAACATLRKMVDDYLTGHGQQLDPTAEAERAGKRPAGEDQWVSEYEREVQVQDEVHVIIR